MGLKLCNHSLLQQLGLDMLGVRAATAHVIVAFEVVRFGPDQRGIAGGAADDPAEPMVPIPGRAAVIRVQGLGLGHALLAGVPKLHGDQGFMVAVGYDDIGIVEVPAGTAGRVPAELADIDRIAENVFHRAILEGVAPVRSLTGGGEPFGDREQAFAGGEAPEDLPDVFGLDGVGDEGAGSGGHRDGGPLIRPMLGRLLPGEKALDGGRGGRDGSPGPYSVPFFRLRKHIAVGRGGLDLAAAGLFRHALFDLGAEVDAVGLGEALVNGLHDARVAALGQRLFDGDHVNAAALEHGFIDHAVLPGAGEAVELVNQDHVEWMVLQLGRADHLLKGRSLVRLASADAFVGVDEAVVQDHAMGRRIFPQLPELGVRAVFGLILRRYPDIGSGGFDVHGLDLLSWIRRYGTGNV